MEEEDPQLFRHPTWHRTLLVLPAAHHWRSIPSQETNVRGSKCPTQLLYEIFLLYLGLISHWHQHCQLGCNFGPSLPKGVLRLKSHPSSLGWTTESHRDCFGADLSFYVCTSRLQGFEIFCTVCEDFCTLPSDVVPRLTVFFRMPSFHRSLFSQMANIGEIFKTIKILKKISADWKINLKHVYMTI